MGAGAVAATGAGATPASVVVVGAGHAGVQVAASLREEAFAGRIVLVSAEPHLPYQRPPLSKTFIKGSADPLPLRAAAFYDSRSIELRPRAVAERIDRTGRRLVLASGEAIAYDHLVLATGSSARPFTVPGHDLDGVLTLRDLDDAVQLRDRLDAARDIVVVGAGFIGLEFAAVATAMGRRVRVVEVGPRPLGRAVSAHISTYFHGSHTGAGAELTYGAGVVALEGAAGTVSGVRLSDGTVLPADLVVVGIGVVPADALARDAGLPCDVGVVVDQYLATPDPSISAIGDCARFPSHHAGGSVRLESVQNAVDQARCVARRLVGRPQPYRDLPWFWSDQGGDKLQIAGLSQGCDAWVMRGSPEDGAFTVFGFRGSTLAVIETVNRPADHMAARRLIEAGVTLTPEQAADPAVDLRSLLGRPPRG